MNNTKQQFSAKQSVTIALKMHYSTLLLIINNTDITIVNQLRQRCIGIIL